MKLDAIYKRRDALRKELADIDTAIRIIEQHTVPAKARRLDVAAATLAATNGRPPKTATASTVALTPPPPAELLQLPTLRTDPTSDNYSRGHLPRVLAALQWLATQDHAPTLANVQAIADQGGWQVSKIGMTLARAVYSGYANKTKTGYQVTPKGQTVIDAIAGQLAAQS